MHSQERIISLLLCAVLCIIPAIAYSFVPEDEEDVVGVYGVAFFHNNMLMRLEYSSIYHSDDDTIVSSETGIGSSKSRLDEFLPTLTMKKR